MQAGEVGSVTLQLVRERGLRFNACPLADYFQVGQPVLILVGGSAGIAAARRRGFRQQYPQLDDLAGGVVNLIMSCQTPSYSPEISFPV